MTRESESADLFPDLHAPEGTQFINDRCLLRAEEGHCVVIVSGMVLAHFAVEDRIARAYAMVSLVDQGWAKQKEVARAFGCDVRTLRRQQERFAHGGLCAVGQSSGYPKGRERLQRWRIELVERFKAQQLSNCEIARRLGVSEKAVRKLIVRLNWVEPSPEQGALPLAPASCSDPNLSASSTSTPSSGRVELAIGSDPNLSAFCSPEPGTCSLDTDPTNRRGDRLLACLGLLDDAAPLFGSATVVARAGVLLALPAIVHSGVLDSARQIYGSIGPAFYGLRTTLVTLLLMALLRIKRPEALKRYPPGDLGRVLGLDRAPEVKTLRRKLSRLAALGRATDLGSALAKKRVQERGAALGFLYLDGHVRVYHGKRPLSKAHVAQMRLALPATTDYWLNDQSGDPLFVVTAQANATLRAMLPGILVQLRALIGERRLTVVFDRGGYSPPLFQQIQKAGFDFLTYRKGRFARVRRGAFAEHQLQVKGQIVTYRLADQNVRLGPTKLKARQVTRLSPDNHQTPILTSRRDLSAAEVAFHMFERWRQENFFKYMRQEYALDALADYQFVPEDPEKLVRNPKYKVLDRKLREAKTQLEALQAEYGRRAFANPEAKRPSMRGFKIAQGPLSKQLSQAMARVKQLQKQRRATPLHVPMRQSGQKQRVQLAPERKHLTNLLKMVAYQAESDLVRLLEPHYRRACDEGRSLIQAALADSAEIEVINKTLQVRLRPLSSAHRTRAIAALCEELTRRHTVFPGTQLVIHYSIQLAP